MYMACPGWQPGITLDAIGQFLRVAQLLAKVRNLVMSTFRMPYVVQA